MSCGCSKTIENGCGSSTSIICGCKSKFSTTCVIYDGKPLDTIDIMKGDNVELALININKKIKELFDRDLITNIGSGEKVFKQLNNLGVYEFRTMLSSDSVAVQSNPDTLQFNLNKMWLNNKIKAYLDTNINPYIKKYLDAFANSYIDEWWRVNGNNKVKEYLDNNIDSYIRQFLQNPSNKTDICTTVNLCVDTSRPTITSFEVPATGTGGSSVAASVVATDNDTALTYQWSSNCGATFSNTQAATTNIILPSSTTQDILCSISVEVCDSSSNCKTMSRNISIPKTVVTPAPTGNITLQAFDEEATGSYTKVTATLTTDQVVNKPTGWAGSATGTTFTRDYVSNGTKTVSFTNTNGTGTANTNVTQIGQSSGQGLNVGNIEGTNINPTISPTGGTTPYTYLWDSVSDCVKITDAQSSTPTISCNNIDGCTNPTIKVKVKDANGIEAVSTKVLQGFTCTSAIDNFNNNVANNTNFTYKFSCANDGTGNINGSFRFSDISGVPNTGRIELQGADEQYLNTVQGITNIDANNYFPTTEVFAGTQQVDQELENGITYTFRWVDPNYGDTSNWKTVTIDALNCTNTNTQPTIGTLSFGTVTRDTATPTGSANHPNGVTYQWSSVGNCATFSNTSIANPTITFTPSTVETTCQVAVTVADASNNNNNTTVNHTYTIPCLVERTQFDRISVTLKDKITGALVTNPSNTVTPILGENIVVKVDDSLEGYDDINLTVLKGSTVAIDLNTGNFDATNRAFTVPVSVLQGYSGQVTFRVGISNNCNSNTDTKSKVININTPEDNSSVSTNIQNYNSNVSAVDLDNTSFNCLEFMCSQPSGETYSQLNGAFSFKSLTGMPSVGYIKIISTDSENILVDNNQTLAANLVIPVGATLGVPVIHDGGVTCVDSGECNLGIITITYTYSDDGVSYGDTKLIKFTLK